MDATDVSLVGMRFHVCAGILPHEREFAQPLEVDLTVRLAGRTEVLDYRALYDETLSVVSSEPVLYLESFAERLAGRVLAMDGVRWCRIAVRKPHVALGGPLEFAQIVIERSHD